MECRGTPEGRRRKECVRQCLDHSGREQEHGEVAEGGRRERNPYFFGERSYEQWSRSEHGRFEVLERFARRSELLVGVENYRLAVLEAEPETFIMPRHWDAEEVFYVMEGNNNQRSVLSFTELPEYCVLTAIIYRAWDYNIAS